MAAARKLESSPPESRAIYRLLESRQATRRGQIHTTTLAKALGRTVSESVQLLNQNPALRHSEGSGGATDHAFGDRHYLVGQEISGFLVAKVPRAFSKHQHTPEWLTHTKTLELCLQTHEGDPPDEDPNPDKDLYIDIEPLSEEVAQGTPEPPFKASFHEGSALDLPDT